MREPYTRIYLHLVWSTWDRRPILTEKIAPSIYACIRAECDNLKADVLIIGGMPDHVHLLVRMPTTVSVAEMMKRMKGSSSHLATHFVAPDLNFKWQGGYGAFSVSPYLTSFIYDYISNQKRHHQEGTFEEELEFNQ